MTTNGHCRIDTAGTYTLTATSGTLDAATSGSFTIFGTAAKLAFTTSSSGSTGGIPFATQPVVAVQDSGGRTTTGTNAVTLTITTPAGATLTCTTNPKTAVAGVATFAGCKINKTGTYTLTAAASGLTSAVSANFTITAGPVTKLAFTTSPSNTVRNTVFATQPVVAVQDVGGNTVTTNSFRSRPPSPNSGAPAVSRSAPAHKWHLSPAVGPSAVCASSARACTICRTGTSPFPGRTSPSTEP